MVTVMSNTGERIRKALRRAGMSESALAQQLDISQSAINKALDRGSPTYKKLPRIAEILGVPLEWVLNGGVSPWESNEEDLSIKMIKDLQKQVLTLREEYIRLATNHLQLITECGLQGVDVDNDYAKQLAAALAKM